MFFIFNLVLVKKNDLFVRNVFLLVTEYVFKNIKTDDIFFHYQKKLWLSELQQKLYIQLITGLILRNHFDIMKPKKVCLLKCSNMTDYIKPHIYCAFIHIYSYINMRFYLVKKNNQRGESSFWLFCQSQKNRFPLFSFGQMPF